MYKIKGKIDKTKRIKRPLVLALRCTHNKNKLKHTKDENFNETTGHGVDEQRPS